MLMILHSPCEMLTQTLTEVDSGTAMKGLSNMDITDIMTGNASTIDGIPPTPSQRSSVGPSTSVPVNLFIEPTFLILLLIAISIANSMLITKIITERRLRSSVNYYLIFQCIGNLGMSTSTLPFAALAAVKQTWPLGNDICLLNYGLNNFFSLLCIINMIMIAYNRYKSLTTNSNRLIVKHVLTVELGIWFICAISTFPWLLILDRVGQWRFSGGFLKCIVVPHPQGKGILLIYAVMQQLICGFLPFSAILWCLVRIVVTVQKTLKSVVPPHSMAKLLPPGCYLKSAYTNILLMGSFLLFWFPQIILISLEKCGISNVPTALRRLCAYLVWLECLFLPLICLFRNPRLIKSLFKTRLFRLFCPFLLETKKSQESKYNDDRPSAISIDSFFSIANSRAAIDAGFSKNQPQL